jgi:hypothetical protein
VHSAGAGVERRLPVWCGVARLAIVAAVVLMWTAPCLATTVVPMSEADLASEAAAVVLGRVTNLSSHLDAAHGQIFTDVTLGVDEVVAGPALPATVTLRQPGGQVGNVRTWIDGSPEFSIGERVLVYLKVARDGTLRVLQLYQGKLSVMVDPLTGDEVAIRITGGGVRVLAPLRHGATSPPKDTHRLDDLRRAIRAARGRSSVQTAPPMQTAPAAADVVQQQEAFVFLGTPSRWFEPDSGAAITVAINSSGQPQAPTEGFDQIRQGLAAWSNDPQANFRYADGGFTSAAGLRFDGVNAVSFNDPDGAMDTPVNCSGTLAMGGFSRSTTESRVVNGTTFMRILDGDVVFNDGWQGCGFYETFGNFAEVATHELGHVLGLGHSTDPTATMFAAAHFDGRGASLKADDLAGLRFIYPATTSQAAGPTLTFSAPANGATVSGTTTVSLAVTGGAPPYAYQVSLDGAAISTSASFSWNTPAVSNGTHTLSATVTDAAGHAASASITVTVANAGGGSAGVLRVAITQPASGATVSGVPWAVMWLEGSNAASSTFTLTLGGQTMGTTTTSSRGPVSMPYDTQVVANGPQPLTATVHDAAGNSGTTTVSVIVSNAGGGAPQPPPPPAPPSPPPPTGTLSVYITSPTSGASVSGTSWVTLWLNGASGTSNTYTLTVGSQTVGTTSSSSTGPVSIPWSTASVPDGAQTLTASARDASGNTGAASIAITVANGGAPAPPPPPAPGGTLKVFITSPAGGATVSGTVWVNVWVEGAAAGAKVFTLRAGGTTVGTATDSGVHVTLPWNTPGTPNGPSALSATVQDASGASGSTSMSVSVGN